MVYAVCSLSLIATILCFFAWGRGRCRNFGIAQVVLQVVVALPLLASGIVLHFFRASLTASIIPPVFPARISLAVFTGICEIAGAIGLVVPRFRRAAAFCIAILMVAIFPANIYSAGRVVDGFRFPSVPVRLTMQIVYIVLVLVAGFGIPKGPPAADGKP